MQTKVVLIGDSIRLGYQSTVIKELEDEAEVMTPDENCGNSQRILENIDRWITDRHPDIVHLNCGLHDLRKERGASDNAVPPAEYETNLRNILSKVQAACNPLIIVALTTPVNEAWHRERKDFDRIEADVEEYNRIARLIASEFDFPINNLYTAVMDAGRDNILTQDGVHYSDEGYAMLGQAVAGRIRTFLD